MDGIASLHVVRKVLVIESEPEMISAKLLLVCATILTINIPFGYWRAGLSKFSWRWFLSVHLPVPLVILLRLWSGLGWQLSTFPLFVGAFLVGQMAGGRLRD